MPLRPKSLAGRQQLWSRASSPVGLDGCYQKREHGTLVKLSSVKHSNSSPIFLPGPLVSKIAWKSRIKCAQHNCRRHFDSRLYTTQRSLIVMPANALVNIADNASPPRLRWIKKNVQTLE